MLGLPHSQTNHYVRLQPVQHSIQFTVSDNTKQVKNLLSLTFSVDSGKKLMPLGTSRAMRALEMTRTVSRKVRQVRSSSDWRQPYGQPKITVFGFMPPKPVVCTLQTNNKHYNDTIQQVMLTQIFISTRSP